MTTTNTTRQVLRTPEPGKSAPVHKWIVDRSEDLLLMDPSGAVSVHVDPPAVLAFIRRQERAFIRSSDLDAVYSVIEWRNMPEGFTPPS